MLQHILLPSAAGGTIRLASVVLGFAFELFIVVAIFHRVFVDEEPAVPAGRKVREVLLVTGYSNGEYLVERV